MSEQLAARWVGVGWFRMRLDEGRLPVEVEVSRRLHDYGDPGEFSAAAMTGYLVALWEHDAPVIARGGFAELSARPSRRAEMITLLDTGSRAEFEAVERAVRGRAEFVGRGPVTEFGVASVTVRASLSRVGAIEIDPRWARSVLPSYIGADIVECADRIRRARPRFHEGGSWAQRSDDELEDELSEYRSYLARNL
ncbi:hypothetical protein ACFYTQ_35255 [Nocardia sp. NPDC004068]|uniref:hypothetical protein n=1 Tax=Nocardia sp. NPDC004068 TaxID=3364303 RepID=UPI0036AD62F0